MNESKIFMCGWLRGFFDGEGSASFRTHTNGKKHTTYCLSISNTDFALMDICQSYLIALGIEYGEWKVRARLHRKPTRTLHIAKAESILIFARLVGFHAPAKAERLKQIVEWIKRPKTNYEMLQKINDLHHNNGLSIRQIIPILGLRTGSHHRIAQKLREAGFHVRSDFSGRPKH